MTINRRFVAMIATFAVLSMVLELGCLQLAPVLGTDIIPHTYNTMIYILLASYSPAAAAVLTALIFHKDIRGFGWGVGKGRYYLYALGFWAVLFFLLPDLILLALGMNAPGSIPARPDFIAYITSEFVFVLVICLGEEIGQRGFAVPQLMDGTGSFILAGFISAILWGSWHLCTPNYAYVWGEEGMVWVNIILFIAGWIGISFLYCWLRLASGSLWPCLLLHAVSDWAGYYVTPLFMTGKAVSGTWAMNIGKVSPILTSLVLAAIVIWYVRRHPIVPEQTGVAS